MRAASRRRFSDSQAYGVHDTLHRTNALESWITTLPHHASTPGNSHNMW
jgi:hypothetical protein